MNCMGEKGGEFLAQALIKNTCITSLDLSIIYRYTIIEGACIGEKGAEFLAQALIQNKSIAKLNLGI
jgi:hypothetical protein